MFNCTCTLKEAFLCVFNVYTLYVDLILSTFVVTASGIDNQSLNAEFFIACLNLVSL